MTHAPGFFNGMFKHLLGARRKVEPGAAGLPRAGQTFNNFVYPICFQAKLTQDTPGNTTFFSDQAEQQVFGANLIVAQAFGFLVRQAENPASALGKAFHTRHDGTSG
jgi:hypothetical protein